MDPKQSDETNTTKGVYKYVDLGRTGYEEALSCQLTTHERVSSGASPHVLILVEHDPVITMGVSSSRTNILATDEMLSRENVQIVETDRGGDVTYHGPGQLVGYPIVRIRELGLDMTGYLRRLEDAIIATLSSYGIDGYRHGTAGVWTDSGKVCSIGVAVRKWTTYHGFALNIDPIMEHFALINPCGLQACEVTSMSRILGEKPDFNEVKERFVHSFEEVFGVSAEYTSDG